MRGTAGGAREFAVAPLRSEPKVAWEARPGFRDFGSMLLSSGVAVTGSITGRGAVAACDASTGKLLWRTPGGALWGEAHGAGYLYALDLASRQILWKHRTARPSPYRGETNWRTTYFLPADGALFYETNSLLVKLQ